MVLIQEFLSAEEYAHLFDQILSGEYREGLYANEDYVNYVKMNQTRMKRWKKTMLIPDDLRQQVKKISSPQTWTIITEAWCGDAAHNIPFIVALAECNSAIHVRFVLRDAYPEWIERYLTNGGKSIPKVIAQDSEGNDLFTWGPRPAEAQQLLLALKAKDTPQQEIIARLQNWYNQNQGVDLFVEWAELLKPYCQ
jgi:hypothetical protein